jgi:hypothetical protein
MGHAAREEPRKTRRGQRGRAGLSDARKQQPSHSSLAAMGDKLPVPV